MSADVDLWQQALAAEHAAIWGFGLVGATGDLATPADVSLGTHRRRRADCVAAIVTLGGDPVASAPAYDVPIPRDERSARRLAASLEESCSVAYVSLATSTTARTTAIAAQWLRESAIATWTWSGRVPPLPGFSP